MNICVYGAASDLVDEIYKEAVFHLGCTMGAHGHTLVFGGGNSGMMGAVARGMTAAGGRIIGIAPRFFQPDGVLYEHCTEFYYTEDMRSRKALLSEKADAFLMTPGGIGTYDEFFEIFTLLHLKQLDKKIAVYNACGYYDLLFDMLRHTVRQRFLKQEDLDRIFISSDEDAVLAYLENQ